MRVGRRNTRINPCIAFALLLAASSSLARESTVPVETLRVPGLKAAVEIRIDRWGVPHIYAKSQADLFFAQGVNAARDRLFQIDLWRRRGLGQLADVFGPSFVEQDRAARLFLYRGDMDREWRIYSARQTREFEPITQRFVAGINAYVDWLDAHPDRTPWEFAQLGYKPARWTADDVIRIRSHGLTRNLSSEVARANTLCKTKNVEVDTIGFGLTIFNIDQEDLYTYELDADARQYKYNGGWEPLRIIRESVAVKGEAPREVELVFTRHGPVIHLDKEKRRAFAVRSGWLEPGMSPYFGSLDYMGAKDFKTFKAALVNWGAPTLNQVYADTKGNIGWAATGLAPKRPNWDGLLPVPGDGRFEWAGIWRGNELPSLYNPAKGFIGTANAYNIPTHS